MAKKKQLPGFLGKIQAGYRRMRKTMEPVDKVLATIGKVFYHLRKIFMSIPVVLVGMKVFVYAKEKLPQDVGILLQESGTYKYILDKGTALQVCMMLTGGCLLMMFLSRKIVYPWVISLFSLVLPLFLVFSNMILS